MGKFKFFSCSDKNDKVIEGLYLIEPTVFGDERGYFMETYNEEFAPYIQHIDGTPTAFLQDNESKSKQGTLRGLHMQKTQTQAKLVRVLDGVIYDAVVDVRVCSKTFGSWFGVVLSSENKLQLYIPEGFLHGFLTLSVTATFAYKCSRAYAPGDEVGVRWNDSDIGIHWPTEGLTILLSEKDRMNQSFMSFTGTKT